MSTSTIPRKKSEAIAWMRERIEIWTAAGPAIGVTSGQMTALAALLDQAIADELAASIAANAAKAATLTSNTSADALRDLAQENLDRIRVYARSQTDPNAVYSTANVPAPAVPSPAGPPGTPFDFKVSLAQNGSLTLSWKCVNPPNTSGTIYEVFRGPTANGPWTNAGGTGKRRFTDETLPSGLNPVTYRITAVRSTARGLPATFNVSFGVGGGGLTVTAVTPAAATPAQGEGKAAA
jgi:hypothetical protein